MIENKELLVELGARIRKLREAQGLSQVQLAHEMDRDRQSVNRLECGNINPSYLNLRNVAKGLGITVSELLNF